MATQESEMSYVLCVDSGGYSESLEVCKVYGVVPDELALARQYIRVIDETGEDYLYPAKFFGPIEVPPEVARLLPAGFTPRNPRSR